MSPFEAPYSEGKVGRLGPWWHLQNFIVIRAALLLPALLDARLVLRLSSYRFRPEQGI